MSHEMVPIRNFDDLARATKALAESRYYAGTVTAQQAFAKALRGLELGIGPATAQMEIDVIDGKLQLSAALQASKIKEAKTEDGHRKYRWEVKEHTEEACELHFFEWDPDDREWLPVGVSRFTIENAQKIKYRTRDGVKSLADKDNWKNYPRNMLWARALSNAATWYCSDVFHGSVYLQGEFSGDENPPPDTVIIPAEEAEHPAEEPQPADQGVVEAEVVEESPQGAPSDTPQQGVASPPVEQAPVSPPAEPEPASTGTTGAELEEKAKAMGERAPLMRRIHAIANELGLDHEDLSSRAKELYGVESMKELDPPHLREIIERLEAKRSGVAS